jgi:hypothetical protein
MVRRLAPCAAAVVMPIDTRGHFTRTWRRDGGCPAKDHSAEFTRISDWTSLHPLAAAQLSIGTTSISLNLRCFSPW